MLNVASYKPIFDAQWDCPEFAYFMTKLYSTTGPMLPTDHIKQRVSAIHSLSARMLTKASGLQVLPHFERIDSKSDHQVHSAHQSLHRASEGLQESL